jgi:hypothetical protein
MRPYKEPIELSHGLDAGPMLGAYSRSVGRCVRVSNVKARPRTGVGRPHTFGWLRRIECDSLIGGSYFEAWEPPEGGILRIPRQEYNKPINTIVAVRERNSVFVISPKGTTHDRRQMNVLGNSFNTGGA